MKKMICSGYVSLLLLLHAPFLMARTAMTLEKPTQAEALSSNSWRALSVGDKVPNVIFREIINSKRKKAALSDFKGKLVILDFWSSSCTSCIALFPHMQSLKDEFKDQLDIILVNGKTNLFHDNELKIRSLLKRLNDRTGKNIQLPVVLNCKELDDYFPWKTIPHEVWINSKGVVIAITSGIEVSSENISAILGGKQVKMRTKDDGSFESQDLRERTLSEILYTNKPSFDRLMYSSTLVKGYILGGKGISGIRRADDLYRGWYITNQTLFNLYKLVYRKEMSYPDNQILIEMNDSAKFSKIYLMDTSMYKNVYSYDILVSPVKMEKLLNYVQDDLKRTFHTSVINEKRKLRCWVVGVAPGIQKSYTKGAKPILEIETGVEKKYIYNYPINEIIRILNDFSAVPLIDETSLSKNIDIDLPSDLRNSDLLIQALKKAGFEVDEQQRELETAVITDKE